MSKTSKYLLMIGIYLFLSLLFLIGIECGLRAFGYGVDLDHLFLLYSITSHKRKCRVFSEKETKKHIQNFCSGRISSNGISLSQ